MLISLAVFLHALSAYWNSLKTMVKLSPDSMLVSRSFYSFIWRYFASMILIYRSRDSTYLLIEGKDPSRFFLNFSVFLIEFPILSWRFLSLILLLMTKSGPTLALSSIIPLSWKLIPSLYRSLLMELVNFYDDCVRTLKLLIWIL